MHSAVEFYFFISIPRGLISEVLHAAHALTATWSGDRHYDALNGPGKASLVEPGTNFLLRDLRIGQGTGIPKVKIDDNVILRRHFCEARAHRAYRFVKLTIFSMSGEDVDPPSVLYVFRRNRAMSVYRQRAKVCE